VDARELVFEVVDPTQLRIEALAYDPAMAQNLAGAALAVGGQKVPLSFVGAASSLREQALPMLFKGTSESLSRLAVGMPVVVFVQEATTVPGYRVPSGALMKNPANQNIVWVKDQAERFEPRVVNITFGWCIHRCHFGPGGRRPRGCRGRVPDQSSSLRGTIPCSSGFSKIAYETGSWSSSGRWC
jgi:hypothetical protein